MKTVQDLVPPLDDIKVEARMFPADAVIRGERGDMSADGYAEVRVTWPRTTRCLVFRPFDRADVSDEERERIKSDVARAFAEVFADIVIKRLNLR